MVGVGGGMIKTGFPNDRPNYEVVYLRPLLSRISATGKVVYTGKWTGSSAAWLYLSAPATDKLKTCWQLVH